MVCAGVVVSGGTVRRSILSPLAHVHSYSLVEDSILMHGVEVGRNAVVRRAILDKNVYIGEGVEIGVDRGRRPRALPRVRRRRRRDPQGRRVTHEGRADDARVPAGGLRRGGRPRRVPRARAARVRGRDRPRLGGGRRPAHRVGRAGGTRPSSRAARALDRPDDGRARRGRRPRAHATPGTRTRRAPGEARSTASRTSPPCTRSSRCGRGRRSSSAAATALSSWAEKTALEDADAVVAVSRAPSDDILRVYPDDRSRRACT